MPLQCCYVTTGMIRKRNNYHLISWSVQNGLSMELSCLSVRLHISPLILLNGFLSYLVLVYLHWKLCRDRICYLKQITRLNNFKRCIVNSFATLTVTLSLLFYTVSLSSLSRPTKVFSFLHCERRLHALCYRPVRFICCLIFTAHR